MDRALISAHGKMVAVVASILQGVGVTTTDEFAQLLRLFSEIVGEDDPNEAESVALWAEAVTTMLLPQPKTGFADASQLGRTQRPPSFP